MLLSKPGLLEVDDYAVEAVTAVAEAAQLEVRSPVCVWSCDMLAVTAAAEAA